MCRPEITNTRIAVALRNRQKHNETKTYYCLVNITSCPWQAVIWIIAISELDLPQLQIHVILIMLFGDFTHCCVVEVTNVMCWHIRILLKPDAGVLQLPDVVINASIDTF